jgi:hypothetical protein
MPKNALFAGVSGTRSSVPSSDPAVSGFFFPMVTARIRDDLIHLGYVSFGPTVTIADGTKAAPVT